MHTMSPAEPPDLTRLLNPRAIAIVGATPDAARIGGQPMRILRSTGYRGAIYPVNPRYSEIEGVRCHARPETLPAPCDLALVAVPAAAVPQVLRECGAAGVPFAIVFSAGFREIGAEGLALERELERAARESGVRVVGPNCIGMMNLADRVFCGFGGGFVDTNLGRGPLAFVSQSGGFAFSAVGLAHHEGIGFDYIISAGNEADLSTLDLLAAFLERADIEIVVAYIEGVDDGRRLRALGARALELGKPVLIWKAGNSEAARAAAQSHTASMTAGYALYRAAFEEGGYIEIDDVHALVDCARAFLGRRLPRGPNVGVVTTSGGSGVLIADGCEAQGLRLSPLAATTRTRVASLAPRYATIGNPLDLTAQITGQPERFNGALAHVLDDPGIDQVIVRYGGVQSAQGAAWADGFVRIADAQAKPVLVAWSRVPDRSHPALRALEERRIPWMLTPARAARAAGALYRFARKRARYERRRERAQGRSAARARALAWPAERSTLSESESKACLAAYGIPILREVLLSPEAIDPLAAPPVPWPVAVKVDSPDLPHKSEAGAVRLGVTDLATLKRAAREVVDCARTFNSQARVNGVLVAEMGKGLEIIAGAVNDPYFGPVVMFGMGGVYAEVLRDVAYRYAPFDLECAREMIEETRGAVLLRGVRGEPAADIDALAGVLARLSQLVSDHEDRIDSIDLNPVFVSQTGAVAADALIVLKT
jgi:acetate---CoA ligase (ADP-forming)